MTTRAALILAAGHGTRMHPLTDSLPKPMIAVAGRSLIDRILDHLVLVGIRHVVVNVHYLADVLEAHLAKRHDIDISISDERARLLGSGGALVSARELLANEPFLVLNSDSCWRDDEGAVLRALIDGFKPEAMDMRFLLADRKRTLGYGGEGDFALDEAGRVALSSPEKPYVMAGAYMLSPSALEGHEAVPFPAQDLWRISLAKGRAYGHVMQAMWMHVGDPAALAEAERVLAGG